MDEGTVRARAKAAILGAFVADSATMSLHWIYSPAQITTLVGDGDPEFFDPPSCPFYKYSLGALSPYGDEALPLLRSVVEHGGVKGPSLTKDLAKAFSEYKGYLNHASRELVKNVQAGKQYPHAGAADDQAHSLVKVPIVVARYAGLPDLRDKVVEAVRTHQQGATAEHSAVAMALILEQVVLGSNIADAVAQAPDVPADVAAPLRKAVAHAHASRADVEQAVQRFGASCHLPGSFQGPLVVALYAPTFVEAVRANIMAAGDQASRSHTVGALLAAAQGMEAIPDAWRGRVTKLTEIENLVDKLLDQRFSKT